jgi:hypothetical protein
MVLKGEKSEQADLGNILITSIIAIIIIKRPKIRRKKKAYSNKTA